MKKFVPIAFIVMALVLLYIRVAAFWPKRAVMRVGDASVRVDIADTVGKRRDGLSGLRSLPADDGMLFTFTEPRKYTFWMRGMRFPLDFIWIRDGKVVDITENVPYPVGDKPPATVQPREPVGAALEVNADFTERHGTKIGDGVELVD